MATLRNFEVMSGKLMVVGIFVYVNCAHICCMIINL